MASVGTWLDPIFFDELLLRLTNALSVARARGNG
jgi:hypothetical protein